MRFPEDVPVLTDGVVTLRAHRPEDVQGVLEQASDPLSQEWTTVPSPYAREHAEGFVGSVVPEGWPQGRWAFAVEASDAGTPRFAATVELRDAGSGRAEIAYGSHPWARGTGVVRRALHLLLDWGFETQGLQTVVWWANVGNWASRRTAWRLGFSFDGTVRGWLPQRGELLDGWVGTLHAGEPREPRTPWRVVPELREGPVLLRPFRDGDVPRVVEACSDRRTAQWLPRMPQPYSDADARTWLERRTERLAEGDVVTWAVADPATDALLGCVDVFGLDPDADPEIGCWTHPEARGRGVATAACRAVVRHCFASPEDGGLGLERIRMRAAAGNTASQHVIEASGFAATGRERSALRLGDGSLTDLLTYDLLPTDHPAG